MDGGVLLELRNPSTMWFYSTTVLLVGWLVAVPWFGDQRCWFSGLEFLFINANRRWGINLRPFIRSSTILFVIITYLLRFVIKYNDLNGGNQIPGAQSVAPKRLQLLLLLACHLSISGGGQ